MLSESKKELLRKFVKYKCENCGVIDKKLQAHRNIKMLCESCHKLIHGNEFNHIKSK